MDKLIDSVPDFGPPKEPQEVPHFSYDYDDTLPPGDRYTEARILDRNDVLATGQLFKDELTKIPGRQEENVLDLLAQLPPTDGIEVGQHKFYLSMVFTDGRRPHSIGYVRLQDNTIAPRLFYKSLSDGFWRVAPDYHQTEKGYRYSKGDTMEHGYARETRLNDDLEALLESMEASEYYLNPKNVHDICKHFAPYLLDKTNTYAEEAFELPMSGFEEFLAIRPGGNFKTKNGQPAREVMKNMQLPEERLPDFSKPPIRMLKKRHSILGEVDVDIYKSRDGVLAWNMAHTPDGKVWINGVTTPKEDDITSYGTSGEVLTAGILDSKPLEYEDQVEGLEEGVDYVKSQHPHYVELLVLDNLQPIKQFRAARQIYRQAA